LRGLVYQVGTLSSGGSNVGMVPGCLQTLEHSRLLFYLVRSVTPG